MKTDELNKQIGALEFEKERTRKNIEKLTTLIKEDANISPHFVLGYLEGILKFT